MVYDDWSEAPVFKSHLQTIHHHVSRPRNMLVLTLATAGFLLLLGLIGAVVWSSLQKSQDIRQKAAGNAETQLVEVTTVLDGGATNLALNQDNTIKIRANTNGENTLGVQLKFCLTAPTGSQVSVTSLNPNLVGPPPSANTTDSSCNGWSVFYAGVAISGFNTQSNSVDILKINIKPTQTGTVIINFNDALSKSLIFNQVDVDSLKSIAPQTYTCPPPDVTATPTPTTVNQPPATPTPTTYVAPPTATPTRTANCNCTDWALVNPAVPSGNVCDVNSNRPYRCGRSCPAGCNLETVACLTAVDCHVTPPPATPTPTRAVTTGPVVTYTPTPTRVATGPNPTSTPTSRLTPTPTGTKNWSEISANCNKSCSTNANCPNNMRCYGNQCRLADNPTASNCNYPADQGIARKCNEYCSDSNECGDGLTCWFNRCRAPEAVDHTDCSLPVAVVARSMQLSCNKTCSSNRDCSVNMRCYNNQCRSASNPTSATCAPAPRRVAAAPATTDNNKGSVVGVSPTSEPTQITQPDNQTDRYVADTDTAPTIPAVTADTYGQVGQKDEAVTTTPIDTPMAPVYKLPSWSNPELPWDERLMALLQSRQAWLPLGVLGVGAVLLVIALLAGRRKKNPVPPVSVTERTVPPANP